MYLRLIMLDIEDGREDMAFIESDSLFAIDSYMLIHVLILICTVVVCNSRLQYCKHAYLVRHIFKRTLGQIQVN
jgi:hypothetical protein